MSELKMKKKPTVIFDLDSTLNNLHEVISESFKLFFNQNKPCLQWQNYSLCQTYNLPLSVLFNYIETYGLLEKSIPLPGAYELFSSLKPQYTIGIITARACFKKATLQTYKWLLQHRLIPHWVKIVKNNKHEFIQNHIGQCDFFLDDCPDHLISVLESGTAKAIGTLNYPWAKNLPEEIIRFENLAEVQSYLTQELK